MPETPSEPKAEPAHILALDGVRGIAILLVLLVHFPLGPMTLLRVAPPLWIDRNVFRIANVGWAGVDLFFVLSGFLITRILLGAREGKSYFRSFYARRFLRIFPLYYGFLLFFIVILPWLPGFRGDPDLVKLRHFQLEYWTYFTNVAISLDPLADRGFYSNGHFWSLAVEEQFYLVWPAIVFVLGRRGLSVFCVLSIIAAPIIRYGLLHGVVPQMHNGFAAYTLMPARMDALAIGGLIAVASGEPALLARWARWAIPVGGVSLLFIVTLYLRQGGLNVFNETVQIFGYSALAITFAAFLAIVVGGPPGAVQALCGHRVLTFFGRYSYGIYMLHFQIMAWLIDGLKDHGGMRTVFGSYLPYQFVFTLVAMVITVAVAWLSWHLYEQQFLKLKRFVPYGRAERHVAGSRLALR